MWAYMVYYLSSIEKMHDGNNHGIISAALPCTGGSELGPVPFLIPQNLVLCISKYSALIGDILNTNGM